MRPIGVFGGTFDPVHYGHLRTALELQALSPRGIAFVPAAIRRIARRRSRMRRRGSQWCGVAVARRAGFFVDDRELRRGGPSYTVLTLEELRAERGAQPLVLIIGMDAFPGLDAGIARRDPVGLAHIVVALRPAGALPDTGLLADLLRKRPLRRSCTSSPGDPRASYTSCRNTQIEISSSAVREVMAAGRDPRYLMPDAARRVILATGCYARPGERQE